MAPVATNEANERPSFSSKSSSVSGTTTIKQGGNRLITKFFGNKSSTKEPPIEETSIDTSRQSQSERFPPGLITPCPFIRPLEHKLQARSEPMGAMPKLKKKARSFDTMSTSGSSAFQVTTNLEKTHLVLSNSKFAVDNKDEGVTDISTMDSIMDHSQTTESQEEAEYDFYSQQLHHVAAIVAGNSLDVNHWGYYIQCYSKGQFNLNHPPEPPAPQSSTLQYLPAVVPPQEEMRMAAGRSYDIVWPNWSRGKVNALISAAMKEFDTCFASISFFDGKYENFKAESGYNVSRVSRSISIAAHALLSVDVLVVLDTKQDWRFKGNPLVCNDPKIRFFAGAPMLSPDGHAVGVFAIFGKEPRVAFDAAQRRELAGYSAMALKDISQQALWLSDSELHSPQSTPLLDRDSDYRPSKGKPPAFNIDHTLVPPGLRYHKVKTPPTNTSRVFLTRQLSPSVLSEQTPPSSSEGSEDDTFPGRPRGFGKNHKQLSVNSDLSHVTSHGDLITPDSEGFRVPTPRPFSASDLTSLNPHPPNTPVMLSQDYSFDINADLTVENFMSLSDNDCAEEESPLIDLATPEERSNKSKTRVKTPKRMTVSSISTMMIGQSRVSKDPMVEAALFCSRTAQNLGYDLMYVVEIQPARPSMTDLELSAPGGVQKKILVAYGLKKPMDLSTDMHLRVLRCRGYQAYENPQNTYESGEFRTGCLIPLQTESVPVRKRSSGLVFGAFRRPNPAEVGGPVRQTSTQEIKELLDAAMDLKEIILKQSNGRRSPKKSNSEPSSPKRYLANEAREIGKHLLDDTPEGYPASEAVEMGSYSPANIESALQNRYPAGEAIEVGQFLQDELPGQSQIKEAVEVVKPSLDSAAPRTEPPSLQLETERSTKSSKNSYLKSSKIVEVSLDAGMERPFHAVARFRPF